MVVTQAQLDTQACVKPSGARQCWLSNSLGNRASVIQVQGEEGLGTWSLLCNEDLWSSGSDPL